MKIYQIIFILILMSSCIKDKPQEPETSVFINSNNIVLITNEGNYGWGEGTVSVYDPGSGAVVENYYKQQNSGGSLGNVCQSICKYNNYYYIVMNNSNKIVVVNSSDFVKTGTINGFTSPRYLLPITYNKAYVSDLYSGTVQIVDLNTNSITGSIPCLPGTDKMALIYNKAFITNSNSSYCYIVNTTNNAITDSVSVGKGSSGIVIDKNAKVWVLSSGNTSSGETGKLTRINPITLQIEQTLNFNISDSPRELCANKTHDTLYYLNNGVYQLPLSFSTLPSVPIVQQGSKLYYGLGINPKDYTIYVSDAIDYVQKSKIEVYKPNGTFVTGFNAGIIANGFLFE